MLTFLKSACGIAIVSLLSLGVVLAGATASSPPSPGSVTILHTWQGQPGFNYGGAVSRLADINRDGASEAIIGFPAHMDANGAIDGQVEVRSGRTGDLLFLLQGSVGDRLGYSVADAGDVDRDHVNDIVVGAPNLAQCAVATGPGRIFVYSGRTGAQILAASGQAPSDKFGAAVGGAGDVNRDGHDDIVVGAPCHDGPSGADAGAAYVVSGRDGVILRTYDGVAAGDHLGWGAAGLGDITGDHRDDYVVGAKDAGVGDRGLAYVYDGRNGDEEFVLEGNDASAEFGWFFVASAGDVNRDGRPDIYVGDFCAEGVGGTCARPAGQAYVFSGRSGRLLHLFHGAQPGDGAGPGRSAGDVDGDGFADVIVGSYLSSAASAVGGRVVVYSGRTGHALVDYAGPIAGERLGFDAVGLGDVNRDHRADLLVSAAGKNTVYVVSATVRRHRHP